MLPVFLLGALAVQVSAELGFGPGTLGLLASAFFVTTAVASAWQGRRVQARGSASSLVVAGLGTIAALVMAALAVDAVLLAAALAVGGIANAVAQPAIGLALTEAVSSRRLGLAFGAKQAAVPLASLLGGLAVPTVGLLVGWRWAYVAAAGVAMALLAGLVRQRRRPTVEGLERADMGRAAAAGGPAPPESSDASAGSLRLLAAGGLLAAAASTSIGIFLVDAGTGAGLSAATAALVYSAVSLVGLGGRLALGWYVDTPAGPAPLSLVRLLLVVGAAAFALLAVSSIPFFLLGATLAYLGAWGWPGVYHFAIATRHGAAPATALGVAQSGTSLGAGLGPLFFGLVAEQFSYGLAWCLAALLCLAAAVVIWIAVRSDQRPRTPEVRRP